MKIMEEITQRIEIESLIHRRTSFYLSTCEFYNFWGNQINEAWSEMKHFKFYKNVWRMSSHMFIGFQGFVYVLIYLSR